MMIDMVIYDKYGAHNRNTQPVLLYHVRNSLQYATSTMMNFNNRLILEIVRQIISCKFMMFLKYWLFTKIKGAQKKGRKWFVTRFSCNTRYVP